MKKNIAKISVFSLVVAILCGSCFFLCPQKKVLALEKQSKTLHLPPDTAVSLSKDHGDKVSRERNFPDFHRRAKNPCMSNSLNDGKRPLDNFFKCLKDSSDLMKIRVAHYGDSQIEGDRVTGIFRDKIQDKFGGNGVGFVPFTAEGWNKNYSKYGGMNWARYTVFHKRYSNRKYGYGGTLFKYLNVIVDSLKNDTSIKEMTPALMDSVRYYYFDKGSINLKFRQKSDHEELFIMYGKVYDDCKMIGYHGITGDVLFEDVLEKNDDFGLKKLNIPNGLNRIKIDFKAKNSPIFYGLLFDGKKGVQADNLPIRGHSGDGLMLIDSAFIHKQICDLGVKLIVFQYGMNTVPYYRSDAACKNLEAWYFDLFNKYKQTFPDISILVIGPGDMATYSGSGYVTYRFMPKINESIKSAATRAGCAYWDVYKHMGGKNSIFEWYKKGLAVMNGHFKDRGQEVIGEELFNTLMIEYDEFLHTEQSKLRRK